MQTARITFTTVYELTTYNGYLTNAKRYITVVLYACLKFLIGILTL